MEKMICRYKSPEGVKQIVARLGMAMMQPSSHGYQEFGDISILDAARRQASTFLKNTSNACPAVRLMDVVLAANRSYNKQVEPHVKRLIQNYPSLTFVDLKGIVDGNDYRSFKAIWGHADEKKFILLTKLLSVIVAMRKKGDDDFTLMSEWAAADNPSADNPSLRNSGPFAGIKNFGPATRQHLRISFGIDTVKPDQRVMEVLKREFEIPALSSSKAIRYVEEIAGITGFRVIEIDQVFVKYGSGYY